jgi:hypothetical protein
MPCEKRGASSGFTQSEQQPSPSNPSSLQTALSSPSRAGCPSPAPSSGPGPVALACCLLRLAPARGPPRVPVRRGWLPEAPRATGYHPAPQGTDRTGGRGGLEGSGRMEPSRPATSFVMRSINMCCTSGRGRPSECGCTGCWGNASIPCAQAICVAAILPNVGVSLCDSELLFNGQQPQKAHLEALPEARVWFRPIHHLRIVLLRHPLDIPVRV